MNIEIIDTQQLIGDKLQARQNLRNAVFPPAEQDMTAPQFQIQWSSATHHVLLWEDEKLVSHIGLITREGTCDGETYLIGGIGGVQTHPDARGKGYAGKGIQHGVNFLTDTLNVDFSLLVCRDELIPYYGRLGWTLFEGDMLVRQTSGTEKFTFNHPMLIAGTKPIPSCKVIDLQGEPW